MKKFHFPIPCSMMTKMSTVVSQGSGENYALKTSHTADEIQVEHALWKGISQKPTSITNTSLFGPLLRTDQVVLSECTRMYKVIYTKISLQNYM